MPKGPLKIVFFSLWLGAAALLSAFVPLGYDESTYAHAAWLISKGFVPYRDFVLLHFPLLPQICSLVFLVLDDTPVNVFALRGLMLAFFFFTAAAALKLNKHCGRWAALTPLLMLLLGPFATQMVEIRHDSLAFCFFAQLLCLLHLENLNAGKRGVLSGLLLALTCLSSEKALLYTLPVFAVLGAGILRPAGACAIVFGRPLLALSSFVSSAALACVYFYAAGSAASFYTYGFEWALRHEQTYPEKSWHGDFSILLSACSVLFLFAAAEAAALIRKRLSLSAEDRVRHFLLWGSLATSFLSYVLQRAAYPYSFVPLLGILIVLAVRGAARLAGAASAGKSKVPALAAASCALVLLALPLKDQTAESILMHVPPNVIQRRMLQEIARLTQPGDPVYDNRAFAVTRPHVPPFMFTDRMIRKEMAEFLVEEVPKGIEGSGCTVFVLDKRALELPLELRSYLRSNFKPHSAQVWVWGREYTANFESGSFFAVRQASYFAEPLPDGLLIDGQQITGPVFELARGPHRVEVSGNSPPFSILWLPRDGTRFTPFPFERLPRYVQKAFPKDGK